MSITVGTYNVGKPDDRKLDAWDTRKDKLISNIVQSNLDVVCLQELNTSLPMRQWWAEQLNKAGYAFHFNSCKEKSGVGLIYKKDKFSLKQETKEVFNTGEHKRAVVQVDLLNNASAKTVRIASLHLYGGPDKTLANQQIDHFRKIAESNDKGISQIILAGDFNAESYDQPCRKLAQKTDYVYKTVEKNKQGEKIITTSGSKRKIDWIYVGHKNPDDQENLEPISLLNQNASASDHYLHAIKVTKNKVLGDYGPSETSIPFPAELQMKLDHYGRITRRDVQNHYNIDKDKASENINFWIGEGVLVQNGKGRDTIYVSPNQKTVTRPSKVKERDCLSSFLHCFTAFFSALAMALSSNHHGRHSYVHRRRYH